MSERVDILRTRMRPGPICTGGSVYVSGTLSYPQVYPLLAGVRSLIVRCRSSAFPPAVKTRHNSPSQTRQGA